jgi:transcriptional regulator with XRE-family HTH domain
MDIGNNIRKYRELRNFTQDSIADRIGISVTAFGRIERNEADVSIKRLEQIASCLDIPLAKLFESPDTYVFKEIKDTQIGHVGNGSNNKYYGDNMNSDNVIYKLCEVLEKQINKQNEILELLVQLQATKSQ